MGRQIIFFLAEDDEAPFETLLRSLGPLTILSTDPASPMQVNSTRIKQMGKEHLTLFLAQTEYDRRLSWIDLQQLPVIEFGRCYREPNFIRSGRLYFVPRYYDKDDVAVSKQESFVAWGDALIRKARRWMKRVDGISYAGPAAFRAAQSGAVELRHNT